MTQAKPTWKDDPSLFWGEMDEYIDLLKSHDWYYMYSDDHGVYKRGYEKARQIQELQQSLDCNFTVWNQHAPNDCKVTK